VNSVVISQSLAAVPKRAELLAGIEELKNRTYSREIGGRLVSTSVFSWRHAGN
jgi:hypothetical protein